MKNKYPFDPNLKNHLLIAFGFGLWIFIFLFFTEPLEIQAFSFKEKISFLPLYSLAGAIVYLLILPIQRLLYQKNNMQWFLSNELLFFAVLLLVGLLIFKTIFSLIITNYSLWKFIQFFFIPATLTLSPIIILSRLAFGRFAEKKIEDSKIEIKGAGNYDNLRLFFKDLIYIQSSDNYVEISYLENNNVKNALIRTKISSVKNTFPKLTQTHRSYLVNTFHFKQWKNKNGKSELVLIHDIAIPVSKTYLENVKNSLNFATNKV